MLIKEGGNIIFILTFIQAELLNGFNKKCNNINNYKDDFIYRCTKLYGGLISNVIIYYKYFEKSLEGFKELYRKNIFKNQNINFIKNTNHIVNYEHGWLSESTKNNLIYCINKYKPKIIVEFGSWFGSSSKLIKETDPNVILFCFDIFQPILHTKYKFNTYNPLDNFYFKIPRIETFHKNMSSFDKVYSVIGNIDINKIMKMFKDNKIMVDLFFIDFEKKTYFLNNILSSIINNFPNSIIVGDDFGFNSVKESIYTQLLILDKKFAFSKHSYIISNKIMEDYKYIIKKNFKDEKRKELILNYINEKILNEDITSIESDDYKKEFINKCLEYGKFNLFLKFIKYYKIDMNSDKYLENNMTIFHIICKYLKIYNKIDKINDFYNYQKPIDKKDIFLLKYDDYLNFNINMS